MKKAEHTHGFTQPLGYKSQLQDAVVERIATERVTQQPRRRRLMSYLAVAASIALIGVAMVQWMRPTQHVSLADESVLSEAVNLYAEIASEEAFSLDALAELVDGIDQEVASLDTGQ